MTREQVREQFPDATEEQITAILDINGTDVTHAKKNNVDPKELKRLQDIETEYTKLQEAGLTDAEKTAKALADAEAAKIDFAKKGISRHLAKIFESGELDEEMIVAKIAITTQHGAMQDKTAFGKDYFRELLERVRSIRASERRIQQQITDLFAGCSIDYDRDSDTAYHFYATIQNKFHYAITGKTAAEIVYNQADHNSENMGLTTWKNAPDGRILKSDTPIAKKLFGRKTDSSIGTCYYRVF